MFLEGSQTMFTDISLKFPAKSNLKSTVIIVGLP